MATWGMCEAGIHSVAFHEERIFVADSTVWSLADEILRLVPERRACPRCGLPLVLGDEMGEPMMQCPGMCDVGVVP